MSEFRGSIWLLCCQLALLCAFAGCTSIRLISDHDEQVVQVASEIHWKIETHLVFLERYLDVDASKYEHNIEFYDEIRVDLRSLRVRVAAQPKSGISVQQIDLMLRNVDLLEQIHQQGISANDLVPLRAAFETATTAILTLELAKKRGVK